MCKGIKFTGAFIFLTIILVSNIALAQTSEYVHGQIIVGFRDDVIEDQAKDLISSYKLKLIDSNFKQSEMFVIHALPKDPLEDLKEISNKLVQKDKEINGKDFTILWAEPRGGNIIIQFNLRAKEEVAKEFIESFNLKILLLSHGPKYGVIKVPEGDEQKWIEIFEKEDIVKYAELNQELSVLRGIKKENYLYYALPIGIFILIIFILYVFFKRRNIFKS